MLGTMLTRVRTPVHITVLVRVRMCCIRLSHACFPAVLRRPCERLRMVNVAWRNELLAKVCACRMGSPNRRKARLHQQLSRRHVCASGCFARTRRIARPSDRLVAVTRRWHCAANCVGACARATNKMRWRLRQSNQQNGRPVGSASSARQKQGRHEA